jgi:hypothetical protein
MVETLSQLAIVANRGRLLIPGRQVGYAEQFTSNDRDSGGRGAICRAAARFNLFAVVGVAGDPPTPPRR